MKQLGQQKIVAAFKASYELVKSVCTGPANFLAMRRLEQRGVTRAVH